MGQQLRLMNNRILGQEALRIGPIQIKTPSPAISELQKAAVQESTDKVEMVTRVTSALTNHFEELSAFLLGTDTTAEVVKQATQSLTSAVDKRDAVIGSV